MTMTTGLWVFLSVTGILLLFAVLSNTLVIFCVLRDRKLRTVTSVLICNLAVSDILLAGFVMPQKLHDITHEGHFYEGVSLCKIVNFTPIFVISSSIYTLVCISFERRRAIVDSYKPQMTYSTLCKIIPALWIFGGLVSIPTLVEYDVSVVMMEHAGSGLNSTHILSCRSQMHSIYSITNAIFLALISYIIPVILMLKNYVHVALFVWDTGKSMRSAATGSDRPNTANFRLVTSRMKLVKLLIAVAVIFTLSWLPFFVMLLYAKITGRDDSNDASGFVNLLLIALATFSTAYNVVLYVVYNPSFSGAIKRLFKIKRQGTDVKSSHERNLDKTQNNSNSPEIADESVYISKL